MGWWALSSQTAAVLLLVPSSACWHLYRVVMHAHRGQTIGKVAARIAVVTTTGLPISWREALLRDSVSIALTALTTTSMLIAAALVPEAAWNHGWRETASLLDAAEPIWGHWAKAASAAWLCSDLLMLLADSQRRSLHDFIAGTVVIRMPRDASRSPPSDTRTPPRPSCSTSSAWRCGVATTAHEQSAPTVTGSAASSSTTARDTPAPWAPQRCEPSSTISLRPQRQRQHPGESGAGSVAFSVQRRSPDHARDRAPSYVPNAASESPSC